MFVEMATVSYDKLNGVLSLNHTEVPVKYRRQGIGHILAKVIFTIFVLISKIILL